MSGDQAFKIGKWLVMIRNAIGQWYWVAIHQDRLITRDGFSFTPDVQEACKDIEKQLEDV